MEPGRARPEPVPPPRCDPLASGCHCSKPMDELNETDDELTFTTEDELELLRGSSLAILLATIKFLKARGIDPADWAAALSQTFAKGWDTSEPWTPEEFLDAVLLNIGAFGGEATVAQYEEESARARVVTFPDHSRVEGMHLEKVEGDVLFDLFAAVAKACGLRWETKREGEAVWLTVSGRPSA